ncbi:MAG: LPS export ABC transporter periplasmic protein LptC [Gammaproteobacteria bacterium]|nr:MAG: LPS export ABC transporter periplasmic protein LptC [Gammaproteobacteria bacterium]
MNNRRRILDHPLFRLLVLGVLSIPLVLMITTPRQKAQKPDALQQLVEQQVSEPDSYMTQLHLKRFTADGTLEYEFHSRRASRQANTTLSFLNEPRMVFLDSSTPWSLESNFGKLHGTGQTVELWDSVHAYRADDSMHIHTSALTLYPERDYAETDRAVTIDGNGTHTEAVGLEAYLNESRMRLLSDVRSIHETKRP